MYTAVQLVLKKYAPTNRIFMLKNVIESEQKMVYKREILNYMYRVPKQVTEFV